jgi:hypothetical protein
MGDISINHISGENNVSDLLTKPLTGTLLRKHTYGILGMVDN